MASVLREEEPKRTLLRCPSNKCLSLNCIALFLQGVHAGSITAEGEGSSSLGTNSVEWHKNSRSVPQKRHSPLKHSGSPRKKAEQESRPRVKPTGWTCGECLQWFPERDSYVSHVKTTHRKVGHRHSHSETGQWTDRRQSCDFFHEVLPLFDSTCSFSVTTMYHCWCPRSAISSEN